MGSQFQKSQWSLGRGVGAQVVGCVFHGMFAMKDVLFVLGGG